MGAHKAAEESEAAFQVYCVQAKLPGDRDLMQRILGCTSTWLPVTSQHCQETLSSHI